MKTRLKWVVLKQVLNPKVGESQRAVANKSHAVSVGWKPALPGELRFLRWNEHHGEKWIMMDLTWADTQSWRVTYK